MGPLSRIGMYVRVGPLLPLLVASHMIFLHTIFLHLYIYTQRSSGTIGIKKVLYVGCATGTVYHPSSGLILFFRYSLRHIKLCGSGPGAMHLDNVYRSRNQFTPSCDYIVYIPLRFVQQIVVIWKKCCA
jgi:hypothetical protein